MSDVFTLKLITTDKQSLSQDDLFILANDDVNSLSFNALGIFK